jgi:hypothetical protein
MQTPTWTAPVSVINALPTVATSTVRDMCLGLTMAFAREINSASEMGDDMATTV